MVTNRVTDRGKDGVKSQYQFAPHSVVCKYYFYSTNLQFLVMFTLNDILNVALRVKGVLCCDLSILRPYNSDFLLTTTCFIPS